MHYALISFLNARPLWWGLTHDEARHGDTFEFTAPSHCADLVAAGRAHLGLVPAIELMRIPDLVAMPEICIASKTEVRSVLLVSKVPFSDIASVALDPNSRTSITLARVLLAERLGEERFRRIRFDAGDDHLLAMEGHDAAVVIGDRALQISKEPQGAIRYRYDLVSEWNALFGDPFVFALWVGRKDALAGCRIDQVRETLLRSRKFGLERLDVIAREASEELALPYGELLEYFHESLHYDFGEPERRGLARFYSLASKYGFIEQAKEIEWLESPKSSIAP